MKFKLSLMLLISINVSILVLTSCVSLPDPADNTRSLIILSFKGETADHAYIVKLNENGDEEKTIEETTGSNFYKKYNTNEGTVSSYGYKKEGYFYFANLEPGRYTIKKIYHYDHETDMACLFFLPLGTIENEIHTDVVFSRKAMDNFSIEAEPRQVYFLGDFFETERVVSKKKYRHPASYTNQDGNTYTIENIIRKKVIGGGIISKERREKAINDLVKKFPDSKWIQYVKDESSNQLDENEEGSIQDKQD